MLRITEDAISTGKTWHHSNAKTQEVSYEADSAINLDLNSSNLKSNKSVIRY